MTTQEPEQFTVAIIGGGIGGLTLALGLLEIPNIDVQVYEAAKEFGEVGLGVSFAPNSSRALLKISPKTADAFLAEATYNLWPSHRYNYTTNVCGLQGPDDGKIITSQPNETGIQTVHRARFLNQLVSHLPPERAHFGKRLMSIDQPGIGSTDKLILHFKDGSTAEADCVVGADGVHSSVRNVVLGHDDVRPQFTGVAAFRTVVPMKRAIDVLGEEFAQNCHLQIGYKAATMSYPIEHGESVNVIMMDFDHPTWNAPTWIVPIEEKELRQVFKGWNKTTEGLIQVMDATKLEKWALHDLPPLPTFYKGRIVLIGDAAHATTPFQGQGAGQAIEDSLTLKNLLAAVRNRSEIRSACRAFDLARRARTQNVVTTSRRVGAIISMQEEGIGSDLGKIKDELDVCFHWLWGRDLDDQIREALTLMKEAIGPRLRRSEIKNGVSTLP